MAGTATLPASFSRIADAPAVVGPDTASFTRFQADDATLASPAKGAFIHAPTRAAMDFRPLQVRAAVVVIRFQALDATSAMP